MSNSVCEWQAFIDGWRSRRGSAFVTANELCRAMFEEPSTRLPKPADLCLFSAPSEELNRSLGQHLSRKAGQTFGDHQLRKGPTDRLGVRHWQLVPANDSQRVLPGAPAH